MPLACACSRAASVWRMMSAACAGASRPLAFRSSRTDASADVLHDHVVDAVDRAPVVHGHDVRMVERGGRAGLAAEPFDEARVARRANGGGPDGDLAREDGVVRAEDLAHASGGDPLQHVIAAVEGHQRVAWPFAEAIGCVMLLDIGLPFGEALKLGGARPEAILRPWEPGTVQPLRPTAEETASLRIAEELDQASRRRCGAARPTFGRWGSGGSSKRSSATGCWCSTTPTRSEGSTGRRSSPVSAVRAPVWVGTVLLRGGDRRWGRSPSSWRRVGPGRPRGSRSWRPAVAWAIGCTRPPTRLFGWFAGIRFTRLLLGRTASAPAGPEDGLRHLPPSRAVDACLVPRLRRDRHQDRAVRRRRAGSLTNAPAWAGIAAAAIGVLQIVTDVLFSTKTSDWKKFRREARRREGYSAAAERCSSVSFLSTDRGARATTGLRGGHERPRPAEPDPDHAGGGRTMAGVDPRALRVYVVTSGEVRREVAPRSWRWPPSKAAPARSSSARPTCPMTS